MRPVSPHSCIFMARFRATPLIFPLHLRTAGSNDFWSFHQGSLFFPFVAWLDTEEGEKEGEEEEGSFASRRMITIDPIPNRFFSFCEIRDLFLFQFYDPWLIDISLYFIFIYRVDYVRIYVHVNLPRENFDQCVCTCWKLQSRCTDIVCNYNIDY